MQIHLTLTFSMARDEFAVKDPSSMPGSLAKNQLGLVEAPITGVVFFGNVARGFRLYSPFLSTAEVFKIRSQCSQLERGLPNLHREVPISFPSNVASLAIARN